MTKSKSIDWEKLLKVDPSWVADHLITITPSKQKKLIIRGYSIQFSGTQQRLENFLNKISEFIIPFCFTTEESDSMKFPWKEARKFFANKIDPNKDGKLGELILFAMVETVLKTPMIAHKLIYITNPNDQIKGADGIFAGIYNDSLALLIGESKIYKRPSEGIRDAFESIDRFHSKNALSHELLIAPRMLGKISDSDTVEYLVELLSPSSQLHKEAILVHPILVSYNDKKIFKISQKATNKEDAHAELIKHLENNIQKRMAIIQNYLNNNYPKISQVFLDFFFFPVENVEHLREMFIQEIH